LCVQPAPGAHNLSSADPDRYARSRHSGPRVTHILEVLRGCAVTPLGAERLAGLKPLADPRKVAQMLAATSEGVRFNELAGGFALSAPADLAAILGALAVEGRALEPTKLLGLAEYLESIDTDPRGHPPDRASVPGLKALAESGASFRGEIAETRHKIEPSGEVADGASPELKAVRDRLRRAADPSERHTGVLPPEPRHGQVPAGPGRHRPERPVRAGGAR